MIETIVAAAIAAPVVGGLAYRQIKRRRTAKALAITTPNGIAEERFADIGGVEQWLQIRGEDRDNPVLLVLHGGPGSPYSIFTPLLRSWEKHFTVVHWDRRGVGKTLGRNGKPDEVTFEQMVSDGVEVAEFLREYLHKDKVILMAGSMGTLIGAPLAQRRPDLFSAYVCTDLYVDMLRNETLSHELTLERLRAAGNTKGVAVLEKISADPADWDLRAWSTNIGWTMKTDPILPNGAMKLIGGLVLTSPTYTLRDIKSFAVGFEAAKKQLFDQFMAFDARELGTKLEIPFFLFQGDTDVVTVTSLAEEYFAEVEAPVKAHTPIRGAGHFAAFTQPGQFLDALLTHVRPLATA